MTMPYSPGRALFEGNGTATDFPFSFKVWGTEQLTVTLTGPDGNSRPASGWTARLNDDGGSVTYLHEGAPLPAGLYDLEVRLWDARGLEAGHHPQHAF